MSPTWSWRTWSCKVKIFAKLGGNEKGKNKRRKQIVGGGGDMKKKKEVVDYCVHPTGSMRHMPLPARNGYNLRGPEIIV